MICYFPPTRLIPQKDVVSAERNQTSMICERTAEDYSDDLALLNALAQNIEKVLAVRSFETDDTRVFAVLTAPIYLKSERDQLYLELEDILSQGKITYISFDNDVYRAIKDDMTEEQKEQVVKTVLERNKNKKH